MNNLTEIGRKAKEASQELMKVTTREKNQILINAAELLIKNQDEIILENKKDLIQAEKLGTKGPLLDRLGLNKERIESMAKGLVDIAKLHDPIGMVDWSKKQPNGLVIEKRRVPLGVIGIIYESRPNVTADAFGLCLKTGNVSILKGGKEAIFSNIAVVKYLKRAFNDTSLPHECIQLIEDTSRETTQQLMRLNDYLDVLIPRGGSGLIKSVVENSTIPVIETGVGNCHVFIDKSADLEMGMDIVLNAKLQRPGVCNAAESLLVHKDIANKLIPELCEKLYNNKVEIRGDEKVVQLFSKAKKATEQDWYEEYLDLIISVKIVKDNEEAIAHINKYGTKHSESIVTSDYNNSRKFQDAVDAAAVYANASTRFTDGMEFGFGAEIGISTQKMHARGPMGLNELTTTKYAIYGDGQVRD